MQRWVGVDGRGRHGARAFALVVLVFVLTACGSVSNGSGPEPAEANRSESADAVASESANAVVPESADAGPESAASTPVPAAGDGSLLFDSDRSGNFEIYRLDPTGSVVLITEDPDFDSWWVRPSPDRTELLFYRTPATVHDSDFTQTSLWRADADGSNAVEVIKAGSNGWEQQGHAEWSPDGQRFVMFAGSRINPQIWTTDRDGSDPVQVTNDGGVNLDPSWAQDGSGIVYVGCPSAVCFPEDHEIYTIDGVGGERQRLTNDDIRDHDPYISPDGSVLAWLSQTAETADGSPAGIWDIRIANRDGSDATVLTPGDAIYSLPRFSPDGQEIFTHRFDLGSNTGFDLVKIDPANGAAQQVYASHFNEEYPSP